MSGQIPAKTQINDHVVCDDTSRTLTPPRALDRSQIACDLERVEVLLKLNGAAVADRPDVGDLCFALLSLPVKPEVIVAESHNSLAAAALKDLVRVKNEFVKTRPWRASGNGRTPSGGETARCRGHCEAHIGSLSPAGGSEKRPGIRHPALHMLTVK